MATPADECPCTMDFINCCKHAINLYGPGPATRLDKELPHRTIPPCGFLIELEAAVQTEVTPCPHGKTGIMTAPQFVGLKPTAYLPIAGDNIIVSMLAAEYIRLHRRDYDCVRIFTPDTGIWVVRDDKGAIVGCRNLDERHLTLLPATDERLPSAPMLSP